MAAEPKKVPAVFYRTSMGTEPVRDWIKGLSATDRKIIGEDIATVERGWPIGMPVCRPLSKGLWEVRSSITGGIGRISVLRLRRPDVPSQCVRQENIEDTAG